MPNKLKNLYPGKLSLPQLDLSSYDPQTIHYHKIQKDRFVGMLLLSLVLPMVRDGINVFDLSCSDLPNLDDWVELFRKSIPTYQKLAATDPSARDEKSAKVSCCTCRHLLH